MGKFSSAPLVAAAFLMTFTAAPVWAGHGGPDVVRVTPLGSHTGEFCRNDRALLFEDPDGTTLLYDPGRSVSGGDDPRLPGSLDVILLSSVHSDHIGDRRIAAVDINDTVPDPDINCSNPDLSEDTRPESTVDSILTAFPSAKIWVGGEMSGFFGKRHPGQAQTLRPGGTRTKNGVKVSVIPAFHSNGLDRRFLSTDPLKSDLADEGLTAYAGPDHGYIIRFSNGLVVYLTGDTGQFGDMKHVVRDFYGPQLVVVHLGSTFGMGHEEGAWAINTLLNPKSVIVTHVNEEATSGGVVKSGSTTEKFLDLLNNKHEGIVPLSGVDRCFNGHGALVDCPE